jgi:hypothetical protein
MSRTTFSPIHCLLLENGGHIQWSLESSTPESIKRALDVAHDLVSPSDGDWNSIRRKLPPEISCFAWWEHEMHDAHNIFPRVLGSLRDFFLIRGAVIFYRDSFIFAAHLAIFGHERSRKRSPST